MSAILIVQQDQLEGIQLIRFIAIALADWRTDTTSDLQLILGLNILLVVLGSVAKRALIDPLEGDHDSLWIDIYDVRPLALHVQNIWRTSAVIQQCCYGM